MSVRTFFRIGAWYQATEKALIDDLEATAIVSNADPLDPVIVGGGIGSLPIQTGHAGEFLTTDGSSATWQTVSGGGGITDITYADLVTAINDSSLTAGQIYKITDRGDRGLFFTAISTNKLAKDGTRLMLCPANYAVQGDWAGVWNATKTPSAGNLVIWGGLVWQNLTGSIGTADDDITLDATNWDVIPKASFSNDEYVEMVFGVNYDVANDWIERQWDNRGNVFGINFDDEVISFATGINYCDISDWNWGTTGLAFYNNKCIGFFNNSTAASIIRNYVNFFIKGNSNSFSILDNWIGGSITGNSNAGNIVDNFIDSDIENNSCNGSILHNRCESIVDNSNGGNIRGNRCRDIEENSNTGEIRDNYNNGSITEIGADNANIRHNTNNGNIETTTTGDISDTIVDK